MSIAHSVFPEYSGRPPVAKAAPRQAALPGALAIAAAPALGYGGGTPKPGDTMRLARLFAVLALSLLTACAAEDLNAPPEDFGDFALGHNVVVAKNARAVGPSRKATAEEWEGALKAAIGERFARYQGEKLYHIGVGVDAYALAVPGVPVVLSPKSVLAVTVNVWDDTAGRTVNAAPKQFTVFEGLSGDTVVGSGLTKTKEEQMATLSANAARHINAWLVENKAWFTPEAAAARAKLPPQSGAEVATLRPSSSAAAAPVPEPSN